MRPRTPELRAEREALSLIHFLGNRANCRPERLDAISADQINKSGSEKSASATGGCWRGADMFALLHHSESYRAEGLSPSQGSG